ncbi:hypothetical protein EfmAA610_32400 (plasmid) [Enterococcus faecium]|nr:hypothetical protein EfmAA610_32400 [Enterococcus faecium]
MRQTVYKNQFPPISSLASLLTVNDLVIIFSLSGKTKDTYVHLPIVFYFVALPSEVNILLIVKLS